MSQKSLLERLILYNSDLLYFIIIYIKLEVSLKLVLKTRAFNN